MGAIDGRRSRDAYGGSITVRVTRFATVSVGNGERAIQCFVGIVGDLPILILEACGEPRVVKITLVLNVLDGAGQWKRDRGLVSLRVPIHAIREVIGVIERGHMAT